MFNDPKSQYLYAFEAAVFALIGGYERARKTKTKVLKDGLWCNAHMWHDFGLDVDLAAVQFVTDVIAKYHPHVIADKDLVKYLGA